jgi:hypothetical protein
VLATIEIDPWSFMTQIFHSGQPSRCCDRKTCDDQCPPAHGIA